MREVWLSIVNVDKLAKLTLTRGKNIFLKRQILSQYETTFLLCMFWKLDKVICFSATEKHTEQSELFWFRLIETKRSDPSQGQLLEMQLLESRLLDTFFEKVICSTEKCQLLDKKSMPYVFHVSISSSW